MSGGTISGKEVAKHNSRQSCWIIVHGEALPTAWVDIPFDQLPGKVYDVTEFLDGIFFYCFKSMNTGISLCV